MLSMPAQSSQQDKPLISDVEGGVDVSLMLYANSH